MEDRVANAVAVSDARRAAAVAMARLAEVSTAYADARTHMAESGGGRARGRPRPGEFAADELSLLLREQPHAVRWMLARSRRLAADLPSVWEAFACGDLDAEQVRVIDRAARRVAEPGTLAVIDDEVVDAAQVRTPKQLAVWLLRLIVRCEPLAFERRHRKALAERRVSVVQGVDGMGYVTGEVSAADAAQIDALLAMVSRGLGAEDPRTDQQRRADLFADLLLGRLRLEDAGDGADLEDGADVDDVRTWTTARTRRVRRPPPTIRGLKWDGLRWKKSTWTPVSLLGTRRERVDKNGDSTTGLYRAVRKRPRAIRIGVVVPLSSLLGADHTAAELADRSGLVPGEVLRAIIADAIGSDGGTQVLFTRLLTDDGGRLLDSTELGRHASARLAEAIKLRAGTCRFPTCSVPAERCDLDHHEPWPSGRTEASNLDPECRRHHRGKTFAWQATVRDDGAVEWTLPDARRYRCVDEPLPVGLAA